MTKLKNTKKGMAKKALSISLVAAMLATSNVPVWAAEDLFSDGSATVEAPASEVEIFSAEPASTVEETETGNTLATVSSATFEFKQNGQTVTNEAVVKDGTLTVNATLDSSIENGKSATIYLVDFNDMGDYQNKAKASQRFTSGNVLSVSYTLKNNEVGKTFYAVVDYNNTKLGSVGTINIVESATVLTGTPVIDAGETENIALGTTLTANTDDMGPKGTEFKYQWQVTDADGKWTNIPTNGTDKQYTISDSTYYGRQIRVAVYAGTAYEETKAKFSDVVTVGARKLNTDTTLNGRIHISETKTEIITNKGNSNKEKIFSTDSKENELTDKDITVKYINLVGTSVELIYGVDYTLTYSQLYHLGDVEVTVNILPTAKTDYTQDTYKADSLNYKLVPGAELTDYTIHYSTTTSYEYTGQKIAPKVTSVTYENEEGKTVTLPSSDYTVQEIGPDAGSYPLSVYVDGAGLVYVKDNNNSVKKDAVTITKKVMGDHDSDFTVEIPEQVWDADPADVQANTVKNAQIKMYDTVADPNKTNDLLASGKFTISVVNWDDSSIKKSIKITANDDEKNYSGSIIRDGEVTKSDINAFKAAFLNALAKGNNLIYNGKQQDYLHTILYTDNNYGSIELNGTKLFLNRDFTYEITKGGTDAGDVSYTIKGAGIYAGTEMVLSNAYKIQPATFGSSDVSDNRTTNDIIKVPFNPSLGDKGADIRNYEILGKDAYKAWMTSTKYNLTLDKDFWLDSQSVGTTTIMWIPTVAENKVAGHGKNENFRQDANLTDRDPITAQLVEKDLNSDDISVEIVDAAYNNGAVVTPKIKVVYTAKDGKEYEISDDYYDVEILRSAVNEGDTGRINVVAKTNLDTSKYPQMYTGNQIADFTVGTPSLDGGKILATNGLETLPSVAYDAEQAASSKGIILPEGKYIVKDKSGNIVDPKYYDVTFSNNKAAGTATITVTGKAPYEGSVSANFTITTAMLPSGTVTLMSDDLSKVYTGEEIKLVKGTDYTISGELAQLKEGTDYMVVYEDAVNVTGTDSKAKIKFVGIGSYAGELVKTFAITPAKITAADVTLGDTTYAGGKTIKPAVTITIPGGSTKLTEGTDYTVDYVPAATNVGDTGKVVITYNEANKNINGADSVKTVEYGVTAKDLKDVDIAPIDPQEATGEQVKPEISVTNNSVQLKEGVDFEVSYGKNTEIGAGTVTITAVAGNKNYTGSQTVEFAIVKKEAAVGQAVISKVEVSGNKVTPILASDVDGAIGYDFVLSKSDDISDTAARVDVSKNVLKTNTNFYYVEAGTYYVYCHAYNRDEENIKQFGNWSNVMEVEVKATTPETPVITKMQKSSNGKHLKVTWTKCADATGYDIVMGNAVSKVNGEYRPVDYGKAVKKITNGNTVTVIFSNIPKGTYYVGLHAYNRTSETGVKVFSKWSTPKKVTINK